MKNQTAVQNAMEKRYEEERSQVEFLRRQLTSVLRQTELQVHHFCNIRGCGHEVERFRTTCDSCFAAGKLPERPDRRKTPRPREREDRSPEDWSWNGTKGRSDAGR